MGRPLLIITMLAFMLQATGCGTIIYPERRNQPAGKIDPQVAILNGLGLLLFIVPGVVAFGVDFATGAIYLPGGKKAQVPGDSVRVVLADPAELTPDRIEQIVAKETGHAVSLDDEGVRREPLADRRTLLAAVSTQP